MRTTTLSARLRRALSRLTAGTRFRAERSGNVAIITALAALPMFGLMGFAIDYGVAMSDKAKLDAAADAASMAGLTTAQTVIKGGGSVASAFQQGKVQASAAFAANAGAVAFLSNLTVTPNLQQPVAQTLTSSVSYAATVTNSFSRLIGIPQTPVKGLSSATLALTTYINYYIVVDNSQSMGIGATPQDMTNLYVRSSGLNLVNGGCVFGCHVTSPGDPYSMEDVAHNMLPRINLRIDSAAAAVQTVVAQAQAQSGSSGAIKIGLYTMSGYPMSGSRLTTVAAPTANFANLTAAASTIDLGPNDGTAGFGDSDFIDSVTSFNAILPSQGNGTSATSPINYVVIITDGVQDVPGGGCWGGHCTAAFPVNECYPLQAKANVGVINTVYNPIYAGNNQAFGLDDRYTGMVKPIFPDVAPNLQACVSSPKLYFEATDGPAIASSLSQLFASTATAARFSQ